jgi:cytosol alanyl aminopeptidase
MNRISIWTSSALLLSCATPTVAPPATQAVTTASTLPAEATPELQLPSDVHPTRYALSLAINPDRPDFRGTADIAITLDKPRQIIWLHGRELKVTESTISVGAESIPAKYEQVTEEGVVKLTVAHPIGPGNATLHFAWNRAYDPRVVGLYLAHEAGASYAYTQFEDIYARRAFPGFDEPAFKTPFDVTLTVPSADVAVANTLPLSEEQAGPGMKRIHYAATRPLPTYLIAWAVGPFDVVEGPTLPPNAIRDHPVPTRGFAPKGHPGEFAFALAGGAEILLLEEKYFGIAYPYPKLDQVAVPDYAYGAMENAGEIHYREDLILFKEGTSAEESRINIASTMAHEQAHQWFGDLVTMRWWDDAWLNESFATWMDSRIVGEWRPAMLSLIDQEKAVTAAMSNDALVSARAIRQPLTSTKNIEDQFDNLTYSKGGGVLAMFERFVGAEPFRLGVSAYMAAHADGSGSTEDLLASISKAAGRDVSAPFRTFLDQAGVPLVEAKIVCSPTPRLDLKQSRYFPLGSEGKQDRSWQIPVCVRFSVAGKTSESCTLLTQVEGSLDLPGCPEWLIPNADGAGYYRWALAGDDLRKLRSVGYRHLGVLERIALAQALRAAVVSGTLPISEALETIEPLAQDPDGEVALEAIPLVILAREDVVPVEERPRVNAYAVKLFSPVLKRVGFSASKGESTATRRLRRQVIRLLADSRDSGVLKEAVKRGLAYAGLADGKFHPEAVDPDLAGLVLEIAVEEGDQKIFDALVERLTHTDDTETRERILGALGNARDAARSGRALALSLDPQLRKDEGMTEVFTQSGDYRTREAAWAWLQANFDALVPKVPEAYAAFIPFVPASFCDAKHANDAMAFFSPRAERYPGMPKNLRQSVEYIRLCTAQAAAQRESARKFFAKFAGPGEKARRSASSG